MDIKQISFKINGSAKDASTSIGILTKNLLSLDTAFLQVSKSAGAFMSSISNNSAGIMASATAMSSYSDSLTKASSSLKSIGISSKGVKLPTGSIQSSTANIGKLGTTSKKTGGHLSALTSKFNIFNRTSSSGAQGLSKFIMRISQLTFVAIVLRRAFSGLSAGFQASIDYTENLNLFMVALGENTQKANAFINDMAKSFYLDEAQLTRTMGLFYQISESLGLASDKAYTLSKNLTKMAYDIASFYNITVESAVTKLQAGLVGETEPLRRIGIIITENNLAETARAKGIKKSIRNMTEQEKIQLRYVTILQQTQNAQSDLARTMLQPENLLRIMKEQVQVTTRHLGSAFIPLLQKIVPHIIAVTKVLGELAMAFAKLQGYIAPEIRNDMGGYTKTFEENLEDAQLTTKEVIKNLAKVLKFTKDISSASTGIDELNILSPDKAKSTDPVDLFSNKNTKALEKGIQLPFDEYDNLMAGAGAVFDTLVEKYRVGINEVKEYFEVAFTAVGEAFARFKETIKDSPLGDIEWMGLFKGMVIGISVALNLLTESIGMIQSLYDTFLKPIMPTELPPWVSKLLSFFTDYEVMKETFDNIELAIIGVIERFNTSFASVKGLWDDLWSIDISKEDAINNVNTALDIVNATVTGIVEGVRTLIRQFRILWSEHIKPMFDSVSPKWMNMITDGTLARGVEHVFELFVLYNVVTAVSTLSAGFGIIGSALAVASTIKIGLDLMEAIKNGEKDIDEFTTKIGQALILGLGTYLITRNAGLAVWAFTIAINLPSMAGKIEEWLKPMTDAFDSWVLANPELAGFLGLRKSLFENGSSGGGGGGAWGSRDPKNPREAVANHDGAWGGGIDIKDYEVGYSNMNWWDRVKKLMTTPIHAFANGGTPQKGSLFIAGEAGAELVGDLGNGGTSVVNKKQMKELGIPQFANGVNVPDYAKTISRQVPIWNDQERENARSRYALGSKAVTSKIDMPLKAVHSFLKPLGEEFLKNWKKLSTGDLPAIFKRGMDYITKFGKDYWEGMKDSKTFGWLFKVGGALLTSVGKFGKILSNSGVNMLKVFKDNETAFAPSTLGVAGGTVDQQQASMGGVINALDPTGGNGIGMLFNVMELIADGSVGGFIDALPTMVDSALQGFLGLFDAVVEMLPEIMSKIPEMLTKVLTLLTNKDTISKIIQGFIMIIASIVQALPAIITALVDAIPDIIMTLIQVIVENIPLFLKLGIVIGLAIIDGIGNIIISGVNWLIRQINKIPFVNIGYVPTMNLAGMVQFADGGYPTQGQMFIAREAGAELVGNIGGKTGVANNDQIVESVSKGVYDAMISAQSQMSQGQQVVVNLDGRKISDNQSQVDMTRGLSLGLGGF